MATPLRIDELTAVGTLLSTAAIPVVQAGETWKTTPAEIGGLGSFVQSGTGAIATTIQERDRLKIYVQDFMTAAQRANVLLGGLNPTVDVTAAVVAAVAAAEASNVRTIVYPAGSYLLTSTVTYSTGFTVEFDGVGRTIFVFRPTAADTMFEVSAGAAINYHTTFKGGFTCYSDDTTYVKIALDLVDVSSFDLDGIYIHGSHAAPLANTWHDTTNGSIGIRTRGREATGIRNYKIAADKPISIAANPNTAATDGEDMDHWNWKNGYLIGLGNYCIEVAAGLGIMETAFEGYQAWVGGTGGFKINDTRVAPTVPSRGIKFKGVRYEQGTDSAGYTFNMVFTRGVQSLRLENVLMVNGNNGITIDGFERVVLSEVLAGATSGTSLVTAGASSSSVLVMEGCIWTTGGAVTLTGLTQIHAQAYRSASYAAPSDAVYAGQITDTSFNVSSGTITCVNASTGLTVTGTTGDAMRVNPQAAGSGVQLRAVNNANTDFEPMSLQAETFDFRYRTGAGTVASSATIDTTGAVVHALRHQQKQGAVLTAANNLTLGSDGNYFQVDGTTQINLILNTGWQGGSSVTLKFNASVVVKHNQAASGNNKPILLAGAADLSATANDTLTLRYDSTDAAWYEMSRAVI